jgi:hypothetical protein
MSSSSIASAPIVSDHNAQVIDAARRTVCQYVADGPEARDLMLMLGIYPGQDLD